MAGRPLTEFTRAGIPKAEALLDAGVLQHVASLDGPSLMAWSADAQTGLPKLPSLPVLRMGAPEASELAPAEPYSPWGDYSRLLPSRRAGECGMHACDVVCQQQNLGFSEQHRLSACHLQCVKLLPCPQPAGAACCLA